MDDAIIREWERLNDVFRARGEMLDRMKARHKRERELVYGDLRNAGAACDAFERAHPEVSADG